MGGVCVGVVECCGQNEAMCGRGERDTGQDKFSF